jgi:hypothetical protein
MKYDFVNTWPWSSVTVGVTRLSVDCCFIIVIYKENLPIYSLFYFILTFTQLWFDFELFTLQTTPWWFISYYRLQGQNKLTFSLVTVGIRVPTRRIRYFSIFSVSRALRNSPLAGCSFAENGTLIFFIFLGKTVSPFRTLSVMERI